MKYGRSHFKEVNYKMWEAGQALPAPQNAQRYSVKYQENPSEKISILNIKAESLSDALERACFLASLGSSARPENIDLHSAYDNKGNLLWADEIYYDLVKSEYEPNGMNRRDFGSLWPDKCGSSIWLSPPTCESCDDQRES